jgi:hypothetical protein
MLGKIDLLMQTLIRQNRDLRIDFFRGIALWCMFIDHLINGSLGAITLKQFGFCDSAELFVLLSGVSAGMVYGGISIRKGFAAARLRMLRRVGVLYRTHLLMLVACPIAVSFLRERLSLPSFLPSYRMQGFAHNFLDGSLLRYQPEYLDVLPLYIVLLLALGGALPLVLRRPRLLLGASLGLYAMTRLFHLKMPGWAGVWYFNPFAWQVIFVVGAVSKTVLNRERYWRGWNILAGLFAIFSLLGAHAHRLASLVPVSTLLYAIADKSNLHPFKLLSILSLAWLSWNYLPATADWLRSRWASPFVLLGQHSLPVFAISVFLSIAGQACLESHRGWVCQILIQGGGSLVLLGVAALAARNNQEARERSHPVVLSKAA